MKTKEVKFNKRSELYAWAATGKPIRVRGWKGGVFLPGSQGSYQDESGSYLALYDDLEKYTGIEEIPAKKAYAYWIDGKLTWFKAEGGETGRAAEFDLEAKE